MVAKRSDGSFDKAEYRANPELYKSVFAKRYLPYLSVLIHSMFWVQKYPRLISTKDM
jgi:alpha-aminoadipic semialdehyde synthase